MTVQLACDGRDIRADDGTSVATALLNAGHAHFRTSVSGEHRGPLCGMGVCHECRVSVDGVPHQRSCLIEVAEGMRIDTRAPRIDRVAERSSRGMDADIVVVGAGPAGIAAAVSGAERGKRVIVLDESARAGGQIWRHGARVTPPREAQRWMQRFTRAGVELIAGATVSHVRSAHGGTLVVSAERRGEVVEIRAPAIVLATGARERFLPFPGSTLPGIVGVGGLQALLKSGLSIVGRRVVIAGSGPLLLPVAASTAKRGADLLLVAEQATLGAVLRFASGLWRHPSSAVQAAQYRSSFLTTRYATGTWVSAARGTGRVEEVDVTDGVTTRTLSCDLLANAYGLVPNTELARQLGCATSHAAVLIDDLTRTNVAGIHCAGESTGVGGVALSLVEGMIAGLVAAGAPDAARRHVLRARRLRQMAQRMDQAFRLRDELRGLAVPDAIVCRCEDVRMRAIETGWTMRKAKLYTRAGMGACQGRTCGAALDHLLGAEPDSVRIPVQPVALGTLTTAPQFAAVHHDHGERNDG